MGYYNKKNFDPHGESDRKNSWYWNVLLKNYGSWERAETAVRKSRSRIDPLFLRFKKV